VTSDQHAWISLMMIERQLVIVLSEVFLRIVANFFSINQEFFRTVHDVHNV